MREARTQDEIAAALRLRRSVFCHEQGVPLAAEQDGRDREALHLLVLERGRLIGTCRLLLSGPVARLGRMAVAPERRRAGAGTALLHEAERAVRAAGAGHIRLHAQLDARGVYDRAGYEALGEPFLEQGIEHVSMEKHVA